MYIDGEEREKERDIICSHFLFIKSCSPKKERKIENLLALSFLKILIAKERKRKNMLALSFLKILFAKERKKKEKICSHSLFLKSCSPKKERKRENLFAVFHEITRPKVLSLSCGFATAKKIYIFYFKSYLRIVYLIHEFMSRSTS